jgi:hypothetical protein
MLGRSSGLAFYQLTSYQVLSKKKKKKKKKKNTSYRVFRWGIEGEIRMLLINSK